MNFTCLSDAYPSIKDLLNFFFFFCISMWCFSCEQLIVLQIINPPPSIRCRLCCLFLLFIYGVVLEWGTFVIVRALWLSAPLWMLMLINVDVEVTFSSCLSKLTFLYQASFPNMTRQVFRLLSSIVKKIFTCNEW